MIYMNNIATTLANGEFRNFSVQAPYGYLDFDYYDANNKKASLFIHGFNYKNKLFMDIDFEQQTAQFRYRNLQTTPPFGVTRIAPSYSQSLWRFTSLSFSVANAKYPYSPIVLYKEYREIPVSEKLKFSLMTENDSLNAQFIERIEVPYLVVSRTRKHGPKKAFEEFRKVYLGQLELFGNDGQYATQANYFQGVMHDAVPLHDLFLVDEETIDTLNEHFSYMKPLWEDTQQKHAKHAGLIEIPDNPKQAALRLFQQVMETRYDGRLVRYKPLFTSTTRYYINDPVLSLYDIHCGRRLLKLKWA